MTSGRLHTLYVSPRVVLRVRTCLFLFCYLFFLSVLGATHPRGTPRACPAGNLGYYIVLFTPLMSPLPLVGRGLRAIDNAVRGLAFQEKIVTTVTHRPLLLLVSLYKAVRCASASSIKFAPEVVSYENPARRV